MGAQQARRAARVAFLIVTMLVTLGACSSSDPMLPFCEGAAYGGQANALAGEAIDAASTGDSATFAAKLEAARESLALADRRLAEASSGGEPEGWEEWFEAFRAGLGETRSILDSLAGSPLPPTSLVRERLDAATKTLTRIGPAADCVEFGAKPSD